MSEHNSSNIVATIKDLHAQAEAKLVQITDEWNLYKKNSLKLAQFAEAKGAPAMDAETKADMAKDEMITFFAGRVSIYGLGVFMSETGNGFNEEQCNVIVERFTDLIANMQKNLIHLHSQNEMAKVIFMLEEKGEFNAEIEFGKQDVPAPEEKPVLSSAQARMSGAGGIGGLSEGEMN